MKHIKIHRKRILGKLSAVTTAVFALSIAHSASVLANAKDQILTGAGATGQQGASLQDQIQVVTNILLFLIGVIAVIAIIIGGIRYTTSNGDASQTKAAKDTILYAVVGLVVAIMAYAIVSWVVRAFA